MNYLKFSHLKLRQINRNIESNTPECLVKIRKDITYILNLNLFSQNILIKHLQPTIFLS